MLAALRNEGFVPADYHPDPQLLMDYVVPFIEPLQHETFHFTRSWMQEQAARMSNFSSEESKMARRLNLPPAYLLIHRVTFGSIGVLCQLDASAPFRDIVIRQSCGLCRPGLMPAPPARWPSPPLLVELALDGPQVLPSAPVTHPHRAAPGIGLQHPGQRRLLRPSSRRSSN